MHLEALAMDNAGTCLIVFLLGDPHCLESGQGSQDGAADPDGVLTLGGSDDLQERRRCGGSVKNSEAIVLSCTVQCTSVSYLNKSCGYTELTTLVKMQFLA